MSETSNQSKSNRPHLSHAEFYRVCEALKKHKQWFLTERPNLPDAAKKLSELSGLRVSIHSLSEAREVMEITWEAKKSPNKPRQSRSTEIRTLATALFRLYRKLDEEPTAALTQLYEEVTSRHSSSSDPTPPTES